MKKSRFYYSRNEINLFFIFFNLKKYYIEVFNLLQKFYSFFHLYRLWNKEPNYVKEQKILKFLKMKSKISIDEFESKWDIVSII